MSAPLVVNTVDGAVWTRRDGSRDGEALYAPEKCGTCPAFVMVTLTELAGLGIVGSADVLPVPVGSEPQRLTAGERAKIAELIGDSKPATSALLVSFGEAVRDRREHEHPKWEDFFCLNLSSYMGERTGPVLRRLVDVEAENERLRSDAAALRAERHSTNEALSDAAVRMRADRDRIAALEAALADFTEPDVDGAGRTYESYYPERSVKAAVFSPVASLREPEGEASASFAERAARETDPGRRTAWRMLAEPDGEFDAYLHHPYRTGHDLPETGGTQ